VVVIEANTVPGMTPSTVLFHQALAETPPLPPRAFLEQVVRYALQRRDVH
jgi:D-alanine-D-alanine ligase-like ATP-grasp enzyme